MPQLDSAIIALLGSVISGLTQLIKGVLLSEDAKRYLPLGVVFLSAVVGTLLALYMGRDPVTGVFEGTVAGLTALGLYATGKSVVPQAVNTDGWLKRNQ